MKTGIKGIALALIMICALLSFEPVHTLAADDETFDHNINYPDEQNPFTALVTATISKGSEDTNTYEANSAIIDLVEETLTLPDAFDAAAYSVDGGQKWKNGAPSSDISKLLNKDLELYIVSSYDKQTKGAAKGATIIKFSKIKARPKTDKLIINYAVYADKTGSTPGQWTLSAKGTTTAANVSGLQIAVSADKKTPDESGWGNFKPGQGINVKDTIGKPEKTVYLIRTAPKGGSGAQAASKPFKVTASGLLKAPAFKIDYKNESIKLKEDAIFVAGIVSIDADASDTDPVYIWQNDTALKPVTKDGAKTPMPIKSKTTSHYGKTLLFRLQASSSGKKPASAVQEITILEETVLRACDFKPTINNGVLKLPAGYEANAGGKWGASVPKNVNTVEVRIKCTAKYNAKTNSSTGITASNSITVSLSNGVYNTSKPNDTGVVTFSVTKDPCGISLKALSPMVKTVKSRSELSKLTEISFGMLDAEKTLPEGTLTASVSSNVGADGAFTSVAFSPADMKLELSPAELVSGLYTFSLRLLDAEGNDVEGFFCPQVVICVVDPTQTPAVDNRTVLVTCESNISAGTVIYKYSLATSGAAAAGAEFKKAGYRLPIGSTIYIYAEWTDSSGARKQNTLSYTAVADDVDSGAVLTFGSTWKDLPTMLSATISSDGKTITATFSTYVRNVNVSGFVLGGDDAGKYPISSVAIDKNDAKKVIITLKTPAKAGANLTLNLAKTGAPTDTLNVPFAPNASAITIITSGISAS